MGLGTDDKYALAGEDWCYRLERLVYPLENGVSSYLSFASCPYATFPCLRIDRMNRGLSEKRGAKANSDRSNTGTCSALDISIGQASAVNDVTVTGTCNGKDGLYSSPGATEIGAWYYYSTSNTTYFSTIQVGMVDLLQPMGV